MAVNPQDDPYFRIKDMKEQGAPVWDQYTEFVNIARQNPNWWTLDDKTRRGVMKKNFGFEDPKDMFRDSTAKDWDEETLNRVTNAYLLSHPKFQEIQDPAERSKIAENMKQTAIDYHEPARVDAEKRAVEQMSGGRPQVTGQEVVGVDAMKQALIPEFREQVEQAEQLAKEAATLSPDEQEALAKSGRINFGGIREAEAPEKPELDLAQVKPTLENYYGVAPKRLVESEEDGKVRYLPPTTAEALGAAEHYRKAAAEDSLINPSDRIGAVGVLNADYGVLKLFGQDEMADDVKKMIDAQIRKLPDDFEPTEDAPKPGLFGHKFVTDIATGKGDKWLTYLREQGPVTGMMALSSAPVGAAGAVAGASGLATFAGFSGAMRIPEALIEAGGAYTTALQSGKSLEEAEKAAAIVGGGNMALMVVDVLQAYMPMAGASVFGRMASGQVSSKALAGLSKMGGAMLGFQAGIKSENLEERWQEGLQQFVEGEAGILEQTERVKKAGEAGESIAAIMQFPGVALASPLDVAEGVALAKETKEIRALAKEMGATPDEVRADVEAARAAAGKLGPSVLDAAPAPKKFAPPDVEAAAGDRDEVVQDEDKAYFDAMSTEQQDTVLGDATEILKGLVGEQMGEYGLTPDRMDEFPDLEMNRLQREAFDTALGRFKETDEGQSILRKAPEAPEPAPEAEAATPPPEEVVEEEAAPAPAPLKVKDEKPKVKAAETIEQLDELEENWKENGKDSPTMNTLFEKKRAQLELEAPAEVSDEELGVQTVKRTAPISEISEDSFVRWEDPEGRTIEGQVRHTDDGMFIDDKNTQHSVPDDTEVGVLTEFDVVETEKAKPEPKAKAPKFADSDLSIDEWAESYESDLGEKPTDKQLYEYVTGKTTQEKGLGKNKRQVPLVEDPLDVTLRDVKNARKAVEPEVTEEVAVEPEVEEAKPEAIEPEPIESAIQRAEQNAMDTAEGEGDSDLFYRTFRSTLEGIVDEEGLDVSGHERAQEILGYEPEVEEVKPVAKPKKKKKAAPKKVKVEDVKPDTKKKAKPVDEAKPKKKKARPPVDKAKPEQVEEVEAAKPEVEKPARTKTQDLELNQDREGRTLIKDLKAAVEAAETIEQVEAIEDLYEADMARRGRRRSDPLEDLIDKKLGDLETEDYAAEQEREARIIAKGKEKKKAEAKKKKEDEKVTAARFIETLDAPWAWPESREAQADEYAYFENLDAEDGTLGTEVLEEIMQRWLLTNGIGDHVDAGFVNQVLNEIEEINPRVADIREGVIGVLENPGTEENPEQSLIDHEHSVRMFLFNEYPGALTLKDAEGAPQSPEFRGSPLSAFSQWLDVGDILVEDAETRRAEGLKAKRKPKTTIERKEGDIVIPRVETERAVKLTDEELGIAVLLSEEVQVEGVQDTNLLALQKEKARRLEANPKAKIPDDADALEAYITRKRDEAEMSSKVEEDIDALATTLNAIVGEEEPTKPESRTLEGALDEMERKIRQAWHLAGGQDDAAFDDLASIHRVFDKNGNRVRKADYPFYTLGRPREYREVNESDLERVFKKFWDIKRIKLKDVPHDEAGVIEDAWELVNKETGAVLYFVTQSQEELLIAEMASNPKRAEQLAKRHNLDPSDIKAIAEAEAVWNVSMISTAEAHPGTKIIKKNVGVLGYYMRHSINGTHIIAIDKKMADIETVWHEAFHFALRNFLTDNEIKAVLTAFKTEEEAAAFFEMLLADRDAALQQLEAMGTPQPMKLLNIFEKIKEIFRQFAEAMGYDKLTMSQARALVAVSKIADDMLTGNIWEAQQKEYPWDANTAGYVIDLDEEGGTLWRTMSKILPNEWDLPGLRNRIEMMVDDAVGDDAKDQMKDRLNEFWDRGLSSTRIFSDTTSEDAANEVDRVDAEEADAGRVAMPEDVADEAGYIKEDADTRPVPSETEIDQMAVAQQRKINARRTERKQKYGATRGLGKELYNLFIQTRRKIASGKYVATAADNRMKALVKTLGEKFGEERVAQSLSMVLDGRMSLRQFAKVYNLNARGPELESIHTVQEHGRKIREELAKSPHLTQEMRTQILENEFYQTRFYAVHVLGDSYVADSEAYQTAVRAMYQIHGDEILKQIDKVNEVIGKREPFDFATYIQAKQDRRKSMTEGLSKTKKIAIERVARAMGPWEKILEDIEMKNGSFSATWNVKDLTTIAGMTVDGYLNRAVAKGNEVPGPMGGMPVTNRMHRVLDKTFRKLYGEIQTPGSRLARTIEVQTDLLATSILYQKIFNEGEGSWWSNGLVGDFTMRLSANQHAGAVTPDDHRVYGNMAGKYVSQETYDMIHQTGIFADKVDGAINAHFQKIQAFTRGTRLLWPKTIIRNGATAVTGFALRSGDMSNKGWVKHYTEGTELMFRIAKAMTTGKDPEALEILADLVEKDVFDVSQDSILTAVEANLKSLGERAAGKPTQALRKSLQLYGLIDLPAKYAAYHSRLAEGDTHEQAVEHVHKFYQYKDAVPEWVTKLNRMGLGDYFGYTYDSARIWGNQIVHLAEEAQKGNVRPLFGFTLGLTVPIFRLGMGGGFLQALPGVATKVAAAGWSMLGYLGMEGDDDNPLFRIATDAQMAALRSTLPAYDRDMPLAVWYERKSVDDPWTLKWEVLGNLSAFPLEDVVLGAIQSAASDPERGFTQALIHNLGQAAPFALGMTIENFVTAVSGRESLWRAGYKQPGLIDVASDIGQGKISTDFHEILGARAAQWFGETYVPGQTYNYLNKVAQVVFNAEPLAGRMIQTTEAKDALDVIYRLVRRYDIDKDTQLRMLGKAIESDLYSYEKEKKIAGEAGRHKLKFEKGEAPLQRLADGYRNLKSDRGRDKWHDALFGIQNKVEQFRTLTKDNFTDDEILEGLAAVAPQLRKDERVHIINGTVDTMEQDDFEFKHQPLPTQRGDSTMMEYFDERKGKPVMYRELYDRLNQEGFITGEYKSFLRRAKRLRKEWHTSGR